MGLEKEMWLETVFEPFNADNSFLTKCFNADEYVTNKTVHIPNAGAASKVEKNRTQVPANAKKRTDADITFVINEFTTDPVTLPEAEKVQYSYDKRKSLVAVDRAKLFDTVSESILFEWLPEAKHTVKTSGANEAAHLEGATGTRKSLTGKDILAVMTKFNKDGVPQTGRYIMIDAVMYSQLIESLTDKESVAFHALADVAKGVVGGLHSFKVMMRSRVGKYATNLTPKEFTEENTATDLAAAIAWQQDCVCKAMGEPKMFANEDNPLYYGDLYSFLVRAGGKAMRENKAGVCAIVQAV